MKAIHKKLLIRVVKAEIESVKRALLHCEKTKHLSPKFYEKHMDELNNKASLLADIIAELISK